MQMLSKSIGSHTSKSKLMRALVSKEANEVGIIEKRIPIPDRDEAVIKTKCALIDGSDLLCLRDTSHHSANVTLGNKATGVVFDVGADVSLFQPGDRVVVSSLATNRFIPAQMSGHAFPASEICMSRECLGPNDGVLADYFSVREAESSIAKIPDSVSDEDAVYCSGTLPSGIALAEMADIPAGGTVAVFGDGAAALIASSAAHLAGAGLVISVGSWESKELLMDYGADEFIGANDADVARRILSLTGSHGVDASIVASGTIETLMDSASITRAGGTISAGSTMNAMRDAGSTGRWLFAGLAERKVVAGLPLIDRKYLERMLRLVEMKRIETSPLTTHTFEFETLVESLKMLENASPTTVSTLIEFL